VSVATFDGTMTTLVCEIDDRKIYNDIRSQIDVTVTTVITDQAAEYATSATIGLDYDRGIYDQMWYLDPSETRTETCHVHLGHTATTWHEAWAHPRFSDLGDFECTIVEENSGTCLVSCTNPYSEKIIQCIIYATYTYQVLPTITHKETNIETLTVRATDATSIAKYGRRVMNLVWPLGQTQQQMQSLIEGYLALYKEPRPYLKMTVLGSSDALIADIFTIKVSDRVTIKEDKLGINQDFFVNTVDISHDAQGLLVGN